MRSEASARKQIICGSWAITKDNKRSLKKAMTRIHELIVYRNFENGQILEDMAWIFDHAGSEYYNEEDLRGLYYECIHGLVDLAGTYGFE